MRHIVMRALVSFAVGCLLSVALFPTIGWRVLALCVVAGLAIGLTGMRRRP